MVRITDIDRVAGSMEQLAHASHPLEEIVMDTLPQPGPINPMPTPDPAPQPDPGGTPLPGPAPVPDVPLVPGVEPLPPGEPSAPPAD